MGNTGNIVETRMARASGHFGEWLQGRLGPNGPIVVISVPCPDLWVQITWSSSDSFQYDDPLPALPIGRAQQLLAGLGIPVAGKIVGRSNIEAGAGLGASTASLLALARAANRSDQDTDTIAKTLLSVEGASDPLMFPEFDRLLWASRQAKIISQFQAPPNFQVLGGCWGVPALTDPKDQDFPEIDDLVLQWKNAVSRADTKLVASLATESYRRTSQLRNTSPEPTDDIARDLGALGVIRAHTGSARGFLFEPGSAPSSGLHLLQEAGYSSPVDFQTRG